MTVPSYTEDLTDIATADEDAGWVELAGTDQDAEIYNAQGAPAYSDNEFPYIQGNFAVTQDTTKSTAIGSLAYSSGGITVPTDGAVFVWHNFSSPFAFGSYATGGFRIVLGSGLSDFDIWYVGGNDKDSYPYGGFVNHVVNPTVTRDNYAGTPTGTIDYVGSAVWVLAGPGKGEPHQVDVMRYGRGSAIFEFGESANYCTIPGFVTQNDNQSNRWGLIQAQPGGYLWKGRMQLGTASNAVDFRDTNRNVFIQWTPKVTTNFNLIEILNSNSYVAMTGFTFQVLDTTTASKGRLLMTDPATVYIDQCTFVDMDTFVFNYSSNPVEITSSVFRRCGQITQGGATFDECLIINSTATVALLSDDIPNVENTDFISDGTGHAIELTSDYLQGGEYNLTGLTYTNYAAVSGSTGNEAIYNNSGNYITLNVIGGDYPTVRNGIGAHTEVVLAVTYTLTGLVSGSEVQFVNADTGAEMYHVEIATEDDGTGKDRKKVVYSYSYTGAILIYIYVHKVEYVWLKISDSLAATNKITPVQQQRDRWYTNPIG